MLRHIGLANSKCFFTLFDSIKAIWCWCIKRVVKKQGVLLTDFRGTEDGRGHRGEHTVVLRDDHSCNRLAITSPVNELLLMAKMIRDAAEQISDCLTMRVIVIAPLQCCAMGSLERRLRKTIERRLLLRDYVTSFRCGNAGILKTWRYCLYIIHDHKFVRSASVE